MRTDQSRRVPQTTATLLILSVVGCLIGCGGSGAKRISLQELRQEQIVLQLERDRIWEDVKESLWGPHAQVPDDANTSLHKAPLEVQQMLERKKEIERRLREVNSHISELEREQIDRQTDDGFDNWQRDLERQKEHREEILRQRAARRNS